MATKRISTATKKLRDKQRKHHRIGRQVEDSLIREASFFPARKAYASLRKGAKVKILGNAVHRVIKRGNAEDFAIFSFRDTPTPSLAMNTHRARDALSLIRKEIQKATALRDRPAVSRLKVTEKVFLRGLRQKLPRPVRRR